MTQLTIFDYAALDPETRIVVQQKTGEIRGLIRQTAGAVWEIGEAMAAVQSALPHGQFLPWLAREFPQWSKSTAYRFMDVYRSFKLPTVGSLDVPLRALYLLAAPSTPEAARVEALERAAEGEAMTHQRAKEIVAAHARPQAPPLLNNVTPSPVLDDHEDWEDDAPDLGPLLAQAADPADQQEADNAAAHLGELEQDRRSPLVIVKDKAAPYITLSQWDALSSEERDAVILAAPGESRFNSQGDNENIEWALWSWNPVTGCEHNCPYCYARDIAHRFYEQKFEPSLWPGRLAAPTNTPFPEAKAAEWMGHKNVFTCSMADLFGRWVPREWIEAVLDAVRAAPRWNFLFLTKFPQRMAEFAFPANAWVGTTVDCQARVKNAEKAFRKVRAGVKWLSVEPLIEPLKFTDLAAFDWLVIGGASRSAQTPEWHPPRSWVNHLEKEAQEAGVKVYEKSNLLARIREYPGLEPDEAKEAPSELRYLPMVG